MNEKKNEKNLDLSPEKQNENIHISKKTRSDMDGALEKNPKQRKFYFGELVNDFSDLQRLKKEYYGGSVYCCNYNNGRSSGYRVNFLNGHEFKVYIGNNEDFGYTKVINALKEELNNNKKWNYIKNVEGNKIPSFIHAEMQVLEPVQCVLERNSRVTSEDLRLSSWGEEKDVEWSAYHLKWDNGIEQNRGTSFQEYNSGCQVLTNDFNSSYYWDRAEAVVVSAISDYVINLLSKEGESNFEVNLDIDLVNSIRKKINNQPYQWLEKFTYAVRQKDSQTYCELLDQLADNRFKAKKYQERQNWIDSLENPVPIHSLKDLINQIPLEDREIYSYKNDTLVGFLFKYKGSQIFRLEIQPNDKVDVRFGSGNGHIDLGRFYFSDQEIYFDNYIHSGTEVLHMHVSDLEQEIPKLYSIIKSKLYKSVPQMKDNFKITDDEMKEIEQTLF